MTSQGEFKTPCLWAMVSLFFNFIKCQYLEYESYIYSHALLQFLWII